MTIPTMVVFIVFTVWSRVTVTIFPAIIFIWQSRTNQKQQQNCNCCVKFRFLEVYHIRKNVLDDKNDDKFMIDVHGFQMGLSFLIKVFDHWYLILISESYEVRKRSVYTTKSHQNLYNRHTKTLIFWDFSCFAQAIFN